jgi:transglutaminase-like putative cysteine protease
MKPYLNKVQADLPAGVSAIARRIWLFNYVRDIPYAYSDNTPEEVVVQRTGDCRGKSRLLAELLATQGIQSRFLIVQYRLPPFPDEVRFIPEQNDILAQERDPTRR